MTNDAAEFWENIYRSRGPVRRANPLLVEVAAALPAGSALDLACGRGGDALWLAGRGWRVTAVDISATAIAGLVRLAAESATGDGSGGRIDAQRHDLAESFPEGRFDLVSAQYFQTPLPLDRPAILRRAAHSLRPDGRLLVVDHGSVAPWSWNQDGEVHLPTPDEIAAELALDPGEWSVERAETPTRIAEGPDGRRAEVIDNVLLMRRR